MSLVSNQNPAHSDHIDDADPIDTDLADNRIAAERAQRLQEVIRAAGKVPAVSRKTGIPIGTLRHYQRGRDIPSASLVVLADACAVSVEWLASGRGSRAPSWLGKPAFIDPEGTEARGEPYKLSPDMPSYTIEEEQKLTRGLLGIIDVDRLADALETTEKMLQEKGAIAPSWRHLLQMAIVLYDAGIHSEKKSQDRDKSD